MKKLKLFLENFLVYGLGGIISKFIPLLMVPVITRIMPGTGYFGINDMANTLISFASAIAMMGMYDAMYRQFFENEDESYKKTVCTTTMLFVAVTSILVFGILLVTRKLVSGIFFDSEEYTTVVILASFATLFGAVDRIVAAPTRMQNKRKVFLVTNTLSPIICYLVAIPLLIKGHYVTALPLAVMVSNASLVMIFFVLNKKWFSFQYYDSAMLKPLLAMALPLVPNFLVYWVFSSCDRMMIIHMLGESYSGLYSAGAKLGNCSQLIYMAFAGGWQFFAFSTMKEEKQVESNSKVFEYLGVISLATTMGVCLFSKLFFIVVYPKEYIDGFIVGPYLFLAPLLQMLFQVISNQFLVIKKTWPGMVIMLVGMFVNVGLNYVLIPRIGIEGAAVATLVGYGTIVILCAVVLHMMKLMVISKRFLLAAGLFGVYAITWRFWLIDSMIVGAVATLAAIVCILWIYRNELKLLANAVAAKRQKQVK